MKKHILLVDGMALLFRGFYATAHHGHFMYNNEGIATNGVFQFLKYFLSGINTFQPTHVICCWDVGRETFRTEIYDKYKQNRDKPPKELIPQFNLVKKAVHAFDLPNISKENYEADDIIGTLTKKFAHIPITIQTGDQDLLQLITPHVQVALMKQGIGNYDTITFDNIYEKRGLHANQLADFKAFTGDTADNYPGIRGIGEVTATKLLQTYYSIENILANKDKLTKGVRNKLVNELDMFYTCKQLAEIKCDLAIDINLEDAQYKINHLNVQKRLTNLGIRELKELSSV